jgi:hypothetical protein
LTGIREINPLKIPPLMGATHHPPTPLADEILQMVSRPLRIAAQSQVIFPVTDELKKSSARDGILGHQL